jgi:hypothetical protein
MAETKYFDCNFNASMNPAMTSGWVGTEIPMDDYIDSSGSAAAYTDSALIPSAIGSGYGQVNGNRYKLKKLRVRGLLSPQYSTGAADVQEPLVARLLLVMDTQPNGAQAQGEDILSNITNGASTSGNLFSFKRVATSSGRFRILKDQMFVIPTTAGAYNGTNIDSQRGCATFSFQYTPRVPIQVNIKSGNSTPTVAGLETCNIFMLFGSYDSNGLLSAGTCTVTGASRAYYCD